MAVQGSNILTLRVAGGDFAGWTAVNVSRSIETAAAGFDLSVTESWPGQDEPLRIYPEDPCKILVGTDRILTGYVDAVEPEISATSRTIRVSGRSKTKDIVDCSCVGVTGKPLQFQGKSIAYIARALCEPFNVDVVTEVSLTDPIARFVVDVGESPFQAIERLAREASVLVTDNADGELVLTRVGVLDGPSFTLPGNILSGSARYDGSQRFTEYIVKGQFAGDDDNYGGAVCRPSATVTDDGLAIITAQGAARRRVLVFRGEKQMDAAACQRRATWEAVTRAGKSAQINVTVRGWRDANGDLYEVNRLCQVDAPALYAVGEFLTVSATHSLDNNGPLTSFLLAPAGGYELEAPKARRAAKRSAITAGTPWEHIEGDD